MGVENALGATDDDGTRAASDITHRTRDGIFEI